MSYWLFSSASQVGIKLGISVLLAAGPGWSYYHRRLPSVVVRLWSRSDVTPTQDRDETLLETSASIMTTWTLLFVIVGSYLSQSAEGFTVKISEHLPTVDCKQTLTNLEVSSVLTSLPLPSVSSSLSCRYFCCIVFPVIQFCMFADVLTC